MSVEFEMNPLKSQANYRAAASLSPILFFYDAVSHVLKIAWKGLTVI